MSARTTAYSVSAKRIKKLMAKNVNKSFIMLPTKIEEEIPQHFVAKPPDSLLQRYTTTYLNKCAIHAIDALEQNKTLEYLKCPHCKAEHLDEQVSDE